MGAGGQNRGAHQRERNIVSGVAPVLPRLVGRALAHAEDSSIPGAADAPANDGENMTSPYNPGRVAGFWYLLLVIIGPLRLIYIPEKLFVHGNATATINNIAAHELLFRLGILADLIGAVILVFLTLAFYRLFAGVDRNLTVQVVIFGW